MGLNSEMKKHEFDVRMVSWNERAKQLDKNKLKEHITKLSDVKEHSEPIALEGASKEETSHH